MVLALLLAMFMAIICLVVAVFSLRDQLQLRTKNRDLSNQNLDLQRALRQRAELANDVAHELKNPITAISCSAEALELLIGPSLDEGNARCLRYIKEYSDHVLRLVGNFLDLSLGEAGFLNGHPEEVDLAEIAGSVVGLLSANANRKEITCSVNANNQHVIGLVDSKHIKQVIFNLVHNAIKFTPKGGSVQINVGVDTENSRALVSVSDTGPGIPQEVVQGLFDPYARSILSKHRIDGRGAGLGLSLCRRLLALSNGEITVESVEGHGTTFNIRVPLIEHIEVVSSDSVNNSEEKPLLGHAFLLVDPDEGARESVAKLLEALGGAVDRVGQAAEALDAIANKKYSAILATGSSESPDLTASGAKYVQKPLSRKEILQQLGVGIVSTIQAFWFDCFL